MKAALFQWVQTPPGNRLARLWRDQGRLTEAKDLLSPIYGWFKEGFDTPDVVDAKGLLQDL